MNKAFYYIPLLRTRAAELKSYQYLSDSIQEGMLPVFELTRARRTKVDKEGDVSKNIERVKDIIGLSKPFIVDITTIKQLSNRSLDKAVRTSSGGFPLWVELVRRFENYDVIPSVHMDLNDPGQAVREIDALKEIAKCLFYRVDMSVDPMGDIEVLERSVRDISGFIILLDGSFIDINNEKLRSRYVRLVTDISNKYKSRVRALVFASSTFPASVVQKGYGKFSYGKFELKEVALYDSIRGVTSCYSDYATVHPLFYPGGGGWVPRVDFPLLNQLYYARYKREDGGYVSAAKDVINHKDYQPISSWGNDQVLKASIGAPEGKSPAHWISVRMNLHMTRQMHEFKSNRGSHFAL